MRPCIRPLIPGEPDNELLWGSVLAAGSLIAVTWLSLGLPTPLCPLHSLTGIPCPTCGITRGLGCLLHGNIAAAFLFNPLCMAILFAVLLYLLYATIVVIGGFPRLRWIPSSTHIPGLLRIAVVLLFAANWIYLILRERNLFPSG